MPGRQPLVQTPPTSPTVVGPYVESLSSSLQATTPPQQQPVFATLVPESIFGWPALLTALQSVFAALPVFRTLPFCKQNNQNAPCAETALPSQQASPAMSVPFHTTPRCRTTASASAQPSDPTDVTMTPVSPADGIDATANSASSAGAHAAASASAADAAKPPRRGLALTSLPDELIAMCYADLSATDLVALEHVSRRLRHLIAYDSVCWKRCTEARWGHLSSNSVLLPAAARHAGTWKQLYSEKAVCDSKHAPWLTLCKSETMAILDLIKGDDTAPESTLCWPMSMDDPVPASPPKDPVAPIASASPVSVMNSAAPLSCLSVVLLIDASSSVTDDDFDAMKTFAKALVDNLRSTHPEAAVAVVQFNQHPKVEVSLTNVCKSKLSTSIENMEQLMGSTDIAAPIRRARQILAEEASPGDRAIVLLTDGQTHADELQESEREARKASEEVRARLYTLGVGRDIDEMGLGRVAAGSEGGMHFTLRRLVSSK